MIWHQAFHSFINSVLCLNKPVFLTRLHCVSFFYIHLYENMLGVSVFKVKLLKLNLLICVFMFYNTNEKFMLWRHKNILKVWFFSWKCMFNKDLNEALATHHLARNHSLTYASLFYKLCFRSWINFCFNPELRRRRRKWGDDARNSIEVVNDVKLILFVANGGQ